MVNRGDLHSFRGGTMKDQQKTKRELIAELEQLREQLAASGGGVPLSGRSDRRARLDAELIRSAFDDSVVGMALAGLEGRFVRVNRALCDLMGYSREELLEQTWMELCHPEDLEANKRAFERLMSGEAGSFQIELRGVHKQGHPVWVNLTCTLLRDGEGRPTHVAGQIEDIGGRRKTQMALLESEERYRILVQTSPEAILVSDLEGLITYASPKSAELSGLKSEEAFIGRAALDFIATEDQGRAIANMQRTLEEGSITDVEYRMLRADGSEYVGSVSAAVLRSPDGSPSGFIATVRDITNRKAAEAALRESERKYHSLFDSVNDAILILDPVTEEVLEANPKACDVYGFARDDFVGMSFKELTEDVPAGEKQIRDILAGTASTNYESIHRRKDGTRIHMLLNASVINFEGRPAILTVNRDITQEKALEQQLRHSQRMEAIGRLAGGVAHDFNNILTVISGNVELLLGEVEAETAAARRVEGIRKAADHAANLTRQLLAFGRRQITNPRVIDINSDLNRLLGMLGRVIGEDIRLETRFGDDAGHIYMDPGQLEQVLVNLFVNARDAMPNGGTLRLETSAADLDGEYAAEHPYVEPGEYVRIAVSDSGDGMPEEVKAQVFEPFFTTKSGGSGLGLATVYGIVKHCGGSVEVESEPGRGSAFEIFLPRVDVPVEEVPEAQPIPQPAGGGETVMVVEDEGEVEMLLVDMLRGLGYHVYSCSGPKGAEDLFREHLDEVAMLLTDVVMPGQSGVELASRLRKIKPDLPVLFVSGYTEESIVPQHELAEGVAFLPKPFSMQDLAAKVREVLDRS